MTSVQAPPQALPWAVEARDLSFSYGDQPALEGLSLEIPPGAVFGLLGPNGSGKSTLLSLLAGLRRPRSGSLAVLGEAPSQALRARLGILFQEGCLDPLMTVRETLWLHGRLFGLGGAALRRRIGDLLERVGLADRAGRPVATLSGGMRRRLELARALLTSPQLLLLDEPTSGLDPASQQAIWAYLLEVNRTGVTIVLATHDVYEADRYCHTVAFIHRGRLVAQGSPADLKANLKRDSVWVDWPDFPPELAEEVSRWKGVGRLRWAPPVLHATVDAASAFVPRLFQAAQGRPGGAIRAIRIRESTLEDAYFDIVGAAISDGEGEG